MLTNLATHAPVLDASGVAKTFGGFKALDGVSLTLEKGQSVGLVGPNGSGKTTFINVVSGVYQATSGHVKIANVDVTRQPPFKRSRLGVNRTFQVPKPLGPLTAAENIQVAARHARRGTHLELDPLEFVGLAKFADRPASSLTTGQQKMLDLARALATGPQLLLVDELGAGLTPGELDHVASLLRQLSSMGITLLVVEHLLGFLEAVVSSVLVLNAGRPLFEGTLRDAIKDPKVIEVFLGE